MCELGKQFTVNSTTVTKSELKQKLPSPNNKQEHNYSLQNAIALQAKSNL